MKILFCTSLSKAQCIDCGKLLSFGSNKAGKQTVHGLKCHLEKNATKISIHCTRGKWNPVNKAHPPAKKAKPDEVLAAHCRADLVTECMKKKKKH